MLEHPNPGLAFPQHAQERHDNGRIEFRACALFEVREGLLGGPGGTIRTVRAQGVIDIAHVNEATGVRTLSAEVRLGIPAPSCMMWCS